MSEDFLRQPNSQPDVQQPQPEAEAAPGPVFNWNTFTTADMRFPTSAVAPDNLLLTGGGGPGADAATPVADNTAAAAGTTADGGDSGIDARLRDMVDVSQQADASGKEPYDKRWDTILNDPRIDRSHSDKTDGQGHELWDRSTDELQTIEVRHGHKDGDPPANYVIDKNGKVHELIPPNKKAMGEGDDQVVIEYDDSEGQATQAQNAQMSAAANSIIAEIQANAAHAGLAPDIPSDILNMLVAKAVPAPRAVSRGGPSGVPSVPGFSNGGNYAGPPGGGFSRPSIPNRAPVGEAHAAVKPSESHFDGSSIKEPAVRKIVQDVVGKNEGHPSTINWNDNGHGISVGIFQWNQKSGELPTLLQRMAKDHPAEFKKAFGADAENMTKESFIRGANISPNSRLGAEMQSALNDPVLQATQAQLAAEKVQNCAKVAANHGVTSEAGTAMFVDLVNQFGMGDSHRGAMKYLLAAERNGGSEEQKFATLDSVSRGDSHWRADRNPKVVAEIKQANLSFRAGSMLGDSRSTTENA